jgi:ureidoacrylate peracid hydrolase
VREGPVSIPARPDPLTVDLGRTAVVVVDMQNDFAAEGGMFHRSGVPIAGIRSCVPAIARVLAVARRVGIQVVYLTMAFEPDLSDAGGPGAPNVLKHLPLGGIGTPIEVPGGGTGRILVRGTWNTEIVPEVAPEPGDVVLVKHRYSGFYGTRLDDVLRGLGVDSLVFTGCTTSICVESTLRDAFYRDYRCLLLEDCAAEPLGGGEARTNHDSTVLAVEKLFGWVTDSAGFIRGLETQGPGPLSRPAEAGDAGAGEGVAERHPVRA